MHARITYSQLVDGATDKALDVWKEKVGPALKQAKGFKGAYVIGNPNTGKGVTVTLWETENDMKATDATMPQTLALFDGMFATQPDQDAMEVLYQIS